MRALILSAALAATALAACGDDDFENEPRPPVPIELTGVITDERVTVSPNRVGAGPIVLTVSNQDERSHTVTLEGEGIRERVGPINPEDTASIQKTLPMGRFSVKAGSAEARDERLKPATIVVGEQRESASDELLLP